MTEAVRRIHKFNFEDNMKSGKKAHVALVDQAANLTEVLVMKAQDEVTVTLSMVDFLRKFFDMWGSDAEVLAGILGFDTGLENSATTHEEFINQKINQVSLLKSVNLDELKSLPSSIHSVVDDLQKSYGEAIGSKTSVSSEGNLGGELSSNNNEIEVEKSMDEKVLADLQKSNDELKTQMADLLKAKEEAEKVAADLEKAKAEKAEADMVDLVKGYTFVSEEDQADVVKALLGSDSVIVATLEKAKNIIAEFAEKEIGDEGEDLTKNASNNDDVTTKVTELLKSRKKAQ